MENDKSAEQYWKDKLSPKDVESRIKSNEDSVTEKDLPDIRQVAKQYLDNLKIATDAISLDDIQKVAEILFNPPKNMG